MRKRQAAEMITTATQEKSDAQSSIQLAMDPKRRRALVQKWTRLVVIHDLRPGTLTEGVGFQHFIPALLSSCQARLRWEPPDHQAISRELSNDFEEMTLRMQKEFASVPKQDMVMHSDVWEDDNGQHYLAGLVGFIKKNDPHMTWYLVALEKLAAWQSEDAGTVHGAEVQATALRSSWRSLGLGPLPIWGCSDNCPTAVKVHRVLDMAALRCGVHLLAIGVKTLLFKKDNEVEARYEEGRAFEKCRAIGKHFYKSETRKAQWQRTQKAPRVARKHS